MKSPRQSTSEKVSIVPRPLMSADELSTMLCVSKRTIWRLLSGRRLPEPLRIGGSVRWRREDIDRWIEQGCPDRNRHLFN